MTTAEVLGVVAMVAITGIVAVVAIALKGWLKVKHGETTVEAGGEANNRRSR